MKTIGIIGGMSWESTVLYYQWINRGVRREMGGLHSAKLLLSSVDFAEIESLQQSADWEGAGEILNLSARQLQRAGASFLIIATNTMHKVAPQTMKGVDLPLLHIVDPTATAIQAAGLSRIGLLGTGFTMSDAFYKGRMQEVHGVEVIVPSVADQTIVHRIIYEELCLGMIKPASRRQYLDVIQELQNKGAEGVILGCTEITLLVSQEDTDVRLFDTTAIHAEAAVAQALELDLQA